MQIYHTVQIHMFGTQYKVSENTINACRSGVSRKSENTHLNTKNAMKSLKSGSPNNQRDCRSNVRNIIFREEEKEGSRRRENKNAWPQTRESRYTNDANAGVKIRI